MAFWRLFSRVYLVVEKEIRKKRDDSKQKFTKGSPEEKQKKERHLNLSNSRLYSELRNIEQYCEELRMRTSYNTELGIEIIQKKHSSRKQINKLFWRKDGEELQLAFVMVMRTSILSRRYSNGSTCTMNMEWIVISFISRVQKARTTLGSWI